MDQCQLAWLESFKLAYNEIMRMWANAIPLKHSPSTRWLVFPLVHFVLRVAVPVGSEDSEDLKCFDLSWYLLMFVLLISGFTPGTLKISPHKWDQLGREVVGSEFIPTQQEAYGDQRLWSAVGWGTMAFVAGKLMDRRELQMCLPKRLCKHLSIDLIQRFANSRIAKDEMEIDNRKKIYLSESF